MKRLGICSVTLRKLPAEGVIDIVKKAGLGCIEWGGDIHVPPTDTIALRVGELTRSAGLECASYGSYYRCDGGFESVSAAVKALGADTVRVWAGAKDACEFDKKDFCALVDDVVKCAELAQKSGQTVAFEYHYGTFNNSAQNALKLLKAAACPNVKTYWQPMYWNSYASEKERVDANLRSIEALRDEIVNVHVYNWRSFDRFELGSSEDEWRAYVKALPTDSRLYLEFVKDDEVEQLFKDAAALKQIAK